MNITLNYPPFSGTHNNTEIIDDKIVLQKERKYILERKTNITQSGSKYIRGLLVDNQGTYFYTIEEVNSSPYGRLKKIRLDTLEVVQTVNLPYRPYSRKFTQDDDYIYFATDRYPNSGCRIYKVLKSDLSYTYYENTASEYSNIGWNIVSDDTYLYATTYANMFKFKKSDMSYIGASAKDTHIFYLTGAIILGDYIYCAMYANNGHIVKFNKNDLTFTYNSWTTLGDLSTYSGIDTDGTYLYRASYTNPLRLQKIKLSDLSSVDKKDITGYTNVSYLIYSDNRLYLGCNVSSQKILEFDTDFNLIRELTMNSGEENLAGFDICKNNNYYIFSGTQDTSSPYEAKVIKTQISKLIYKPEGDYIEQEEDISSIERFGSSKIIYEKDIPEGTSLSLQTRYFNGTEWSGWLDTSSGVDFLKYLGIEEKQNLSGYKIQYQILLTTENEDITPQFISCYILIKPAPIEPPPITEPSNLIFPTVFKPYFQIRLLNKDLQMISFIDSFEYFIWERSWRDLDKFSFLSKRDLDYTIGNIIVFEFMSMKRAGRITSRKTNLDSSGVRYWTIEGRTYGLFNHRLALAGINSGDGYDTQNDYAEVAMKHYVRANNTGPRMIPLEIEPNKNIGKVITYKARLQYINEILRDISNMSGLGWDVELRNNKFTFCVYEGYDTPVIVSSKYDNLINFEFEENEDNRKTLAVVGGEGEEASRVFEYVGTGTGFDRLEGFTDAREGNLVDAGNAYLNELEELSVSFDYIDGRPFKYGKDFNLGDLITVQEMGFNRKLRLEEVTESIDREGITIKLKVGKDIDFVNLLKLNEKNFKKESMK